MAVANYNERAWAIDLIGHLKQIAHHEHQPVRDVGGEQTITDGDVSLFPDVLLFGDRSAARILQGWELKFPDTDIADDEFRQNAELKARMLGLDSFVLWNVRYARLYRLTPNDDSYELHTEWTDLQDIRHRRNVHEHRARWEALGAEILHTVNLQIGSGDIEGRQFVDAYRSGGLASLILANTDLVASALQDAANADRTLRAEIILWWERYRNEYDGDEPCIALARANLLNWMGKFLLAHVLRERDQRAAIVADIGEETTPRRALDLFERISRHCDFWTVFCDSIGLCVVPADCWKQLCQFNRLLSDLRLGSVDQGQISTLLEASAKVGDRKLRGQFTTPASLARLLVKLGIGSVNDRILDPCCGSGTIARAALNLKLASAIPGAIAAAQVFASDFDQQAVQLATFSLATPLLMSQPLRIFGLDAFTLRPDLDVEYRSPNDGAVVCEPLGTFNCIASNLPFVAQAGRGIYGEATQSVSEMLRQSGKSLPDRADVAAFLPFALHKLLEPGGRLVIVITNAWLGTAWGEKFYDRLTDFYRLRAIITSGAGRWFANSKVVTNVLVLQKPRDGDGPDDGTSFVVLKQPIDSLDNDGDADNVAAQIELGRPQDDLLSIRIVTRAQIAEFRRYGLAGTAQFVGADWLLRCPLTPVSAQFEIRRGERRGWDEMFYPRPGHDIEDEYIRPVLMSSTGFDRYVAVADRDAFSCAATLDELERKDHSGAIGWINRFEKSRNNKNKPLPEVLAKANHFWYEMKADSVAELVIPLAYGDRLYVGRLQPPAFVNQRLTSLSSKAGTDVGLAHALLNSTIGLFLIEGLGFGRGQGALDLNKDRIAAHLHMLDPARLTAKQAQRIIAAFEPVKARPIMDISDELDQPDRIAFDDVILAEFGIRTDRETIYAGLRALVAIRQAARS